MPLTLPVPPQMSQDRPPPVERELWVASDGVQLAGTLCLPDDTGPHPAVLLVQGSGPADRNEHPHSPSLNAFNQIARYLAERGIASLRYDKRGCGWSAGRFVATGHTDLVADASCWLDALLRQPECRTDAVFVLGHSEGSVIAPQVFLRAPHLAGLVLLCPFVENFEQVLLRQAEQFATELGSGAQRGLRSALFHWAGASVSAQKRVFARIKSSTADSLWVRFQRIPARWYRELFELDLAALYAQVNCPTLILGGEKDLQCRPGDVAEIAALVNGEVTAEVVPELTHVLRRQTGAPRLGDSRKLLAQPVEPVVMEAITLWIEAQLGASQ